MSGRFSPHSNRQIDPSDKSQNEEGQDTEMRKRPSGKFRKAAEISKVPSEASLKDKINIVNSAANAYDAKLETKVIVRKIPDELLPEEFLRSLENLQIQLSTPEKTGPVLAVSLMTWIQFSPSRSSSSDSPASAFLNFMSKAAALAFMEAYQSHTFVDRDGLPSKPVVALAPFQRLPVQHESSPHLSLPEGQTLFDYYLEHLDELTKRCFIVSDKRKGQIEQSAAYLNFVNRIETENIVGPLPAGPSDGVKFLSGALDASSATDPSCSSPQVTPIIKSLIHKSQTAAKETTRETRTKRQPKRGNNSGTPEKKVEGSKGGVSPTTGSTNQPVDGPETGRKDAPRNQRAKKADSRKQEKQDTSRRAGDPPLTSTPSKGSRPPIQLLKRDNQT